jgi:hypothetical protein
MEKDTLLQQRKEAEVITARLFRFRTRRSTGLFYCLVSISPILGTILHFTLPLSLAIAGTLASFLVMWWIARLWGFGRFSRMQYSLDFLKGDKGAVYDEKKDSRLFFRKNFVRFVALIWPGFGYVIANEEGAPLLAILFLVFFVSQLILVRIFSSSAKNGGIFQRKPEDWAAIFGAVCIAILAVIPGSPWWTSALMCPIFLASGIKSLYDAPKELALVVF